MNQEQKAIIKETFNTIADGYDTDALRFFPASAAYLVTLPELQGHERVLDVACGTGHASLAIAPRLPRGTVTAVDFSAGMLAQARSKAMARGIDNIEFPPGSQIIVERERCTYYSKEFWSNLMNIIPKEIGINGGAEAHIIERSIQIIFENKYKEKN